MNKGRVEATTENMEGLIIWEKPFDHHGHVGIKEVIRGFPLLFKFGFTSLRKIVKYQLQADRTGNTW